MTIEVEAGVALEGRLLRPAGPPAGAAVVCHPHPLMAGSMSSLLIPTIQRALAAAGWLALRFNFRGVGRSTGAFDRGLGELQPEIETLTRSRPSEERPTSRVAHARCTRHPP